MPSLIPGYEYDIFISYRQKDNKGDRWVSEFVEALKTELESTFKEETSIYFDINPHDGLLETHDVDASLKDKLKCLIFIPIISRTYCDTKSFAWKNEFEAFVEQASKDQFGLKVTLPNGNIAGRVLPVRIHDLDITDFELCESIIGEELSSVEFIYKEQGVSRPLRSKEDIPGNNLNKTFYRNQINKVANAVNEIISGMRGKPDKSVEEIFEKKEHKKQINKDVKSLKSKRNKLLIGAGILAILITVLFVWPGLIGKNKLGGLVSKDGKIPIAVMPFQNMTNDTLWDVWQDGIQNILITNLSNSEDLKVRQLGTIARILESKGLTDYASLTPSAASLISKKLETNVNITGSIKQSGGTIRVNAQVVDTKTGEALKSFQIDGTADNILPAADSLSRMVKNFLMISLLHNEVSDYDPYPAPPIRSPEAYRYMLYGGKAFQKYDYSTAIDLFKQAMKIDSTIYLYGAIAVAFFNMGEFGQAKDWCLKGYSKLDLMDMYDKLTIKTLCACFFETRNEEIRLLKEMIGLDDQDPGWHYNLGDVYWQMHQADKAIPEFEKNLEIYKKWDSKPGWVFAYVELGDSYHWAGQYKKEKKLYRKAEKDFPGNEWLIYNQAILAVTLGDSSASNRYIQEFTSIVKDLSWSEAEIAVRLAEIYDKAESLDKAEEYYRKAVALEPENWKWMNCLASILIDKERNIEEGLELIDKALQLSPNTFNLYNWKGWGFYKQGKYKEALELLQKADSLHLHVYNYWLNLHLEAARKAIAGQN